MEDDVTLLVPEPRVALDKHLAAPSRTAVSPRRRGRAGGAGAGAREGGGDLANAAPEEEVVVLLQVQELDELGARRALGQRTQPRRTEAQEELSLGGGAEEAGACSRRRGRCRTPRR